MKLLLITPIHPILEFTLPLPKYQIQNYWLRALVNLGHQVKVFGLKSNQVKILNNLKLNNLISQFKPDQVLFSAGLDKLMPIKKTIFFSGVPPQTLSQAEKKIGMLAKLIVVNDPVHQKNWQQLTKTKVINLPFSGASKTVFKPSNRKKTIDFSFVGTLFKDRQLKLANFIKEGINLKIWGWLPPQTNLLPELKSAYQGEAWGNKVVKIYQQSKAALNLVPTHMVDGGNLRTFEIPACNALQFIDKINPKYYKPNQEIIKFSSPTDLKNKLKYYLSHPAKAKLIAKAGCQKTIKSHTFEHRFKKLSSFL